MSKLLCGGSRRGLRPVLALRACASLAIAFASTAQAHAQPAHLYHSGYRWLGASVGSTCTAPSGWLGQPLLQGTQGPAALSALCLYTWHQVAQGPQSGGQGVPPSASD